MMLFHYTVSFHPEDEELYRDSMKNGIVIESGLVSAKSYGEAADRMVEYFGKENICEITLYECENPLSEDELKNF